MDSYIIKDLTLILIIIGIIELCLYKIFRYFHKTEVVNAKFVREKVEDRSGDGYGVTDSYVSQQFFSFNLKSGEKKNNKPLQKGTYSFIKIGRIKKLIYSHKKDRLIAKYNIFRFIWFPIIIFQYRALIDIGDLYFFIGIVLSLLSIYLFSRPRQDLNNINKN